VPPRERTVDAGFTLVETIMVTVLIGILGALAVTAFLNYARAADLEGSADDVVSILRTTAQQSLTEGRTVCVHFDDAADTYTVYRSSCAATSTVTTPTKQTRGPAVISSPSFVPANAATDVCFVGDDCAYFYPRGTASAGSVVVERPGGKTINIDVEGLTSRVVRD
jgi:prepilin-type N-terminal cleavage/methylation domain-containing protein